jgi:2'-5' RNA ligase
MEATAGGGAPFELSMDRLGSFGPPHAMTVLWAGLTDPSSGLVGLHRRVSDQLTDRHIAFDPKPLAPHITLARAKRPVDRTVSLRLATAIQQIRIPAGLSMTVERFVLMRSHLSPKGPAYEVLNHFLIGSRQ